MREDRSGSSLKGKAGEGLYRGRFATDEDHLRWEKRIARAYAAGVELCDMEARFGASASQLVDVAKRHGVPPRYSKMAAARRGERTRASARPGQGYIVNRSFDR